MAPASGKKTNDASSSAKLTAKASTPGTNSHKSAASRKKATATTKDTNVPQPSASNAPTTARTTRTSTKTAAANANMPPPDPPIDPKPPKRKRKDDTDVVSAPTPTTTSDAETAQPPVKKSKKKDGSESVTATTTEPPSTAAKKKKDARKKDAMKKDATKKDATKKATPTPLHQSSKENVPPTQAAKQKRKPTAADREQQLISTEKAAQEQYVKSLEAHCNRTPGAKNKRLEQHATQKAPSVNDGNPEQLIDEPKAPGYKLKEEMGLSNDDRKYGSIQRSVRDIARRTLDFDSPWKKQDPIAVGDLLRA
ncbi:hypothetical protein FRB90_003393, partial [Tulasnella sp. 427]